jgi:hypothetical protein
VKLDHAGIYTRNTLQDRLGDMWNYFWKQWVPLVTKGEDYVIVHNGDIIDGVHHKTTHQISHNLTDQKKIAIQMLEPVINNGKCVGYYQIRGTDVHSGESGAQEETIAEELGAIKDEFKNFSRFELWMKMNGSLIHFTHHVGMTSSTSYESTALHKELVEAYNESGRFGNRPPDCVVRSHRHRQFEEKLSSKNGYAIGFITPAWQLKIPFVYKVVLGRSSTPQIGGYLIRCGDEDPMYTRFKVWSMERTKTVTI